ncbi:hypothetical protein ANANG_G00129270 [Anguilla anguilla]|uniref:PID domain-containing protein n=1 Tax=Anguilla anguilla TaxID=7936 RepID=A0A9D3MEX5_ANGAN|nr:hypothetical protein ANANG_G00129270 [Anguilla anguilla]
MIDTMAWCKGPRARHVTSFSFAQTSPTGTDCVSLQTPAELAKSPELVYTLPDDAEVQAERALPEGADAEVKLEDIADPGQEPSRCRYKVAYLGKVTISGSQFPSGCTESAVTGLWEAAGPGQPRGRRPPEIRPFQVRLRLDERGEAASAAAETQQVSRIAYCTAEHAVSPSVFAWVHRRINDDLSFQLDCHAVECGSRVEAKRLAHAMMEAFRQTLHRMHSEGRIQAPPPAGDSAPGMI